MKLIHAALGNGGKKVTTAKGERYQVRWYLAVPASATPKERKRSDFTTKELARKFIENLEWADLRHDGWCFDHAGDPMQRSALAPSVLSCVEAYVDARWRIDWKEKQREKAIGRLRQLVILTLGRTSDSARLADAYEAQRRDRGARPEPKTDVEWAGRWLRDHSFLPHSPATEPALLAGKAWIERNSLPVSAIDHARAAQLRNHFGAGDGHTGSTQRTYWSGIIVPFLNWCVDTERLDKNPLAALPTIRRDKELERPESKEIPDPNQVSRLATWFGERHGELWALWVYVVCYCALRGAESFAIKGTSFNVDAGGRWTLAVKLQEGRNSSAASDSGNSTRRTTGTKSTRDRTKPVRHIPVPTWLAEKLLTHFGDRLGTDERHLFVGPRGAVAPTGVGDWFREAVAHCFGTDPHLAGMTPHRLRHAGMTYWFAAGIDHARVQQWGGWSSLKEMLDTYRGVLRSLEEEQLAGLDTFHDHWQHDETPVIDEQDTPASDPELPEVTDTDELAVVMDLDAFRSRRSHAASGGPTTEAHGK